MRVFTVHRLGLGGGREEVALVKEGFCWPAAIFSVLWAVWHRLWWQAAALAGLWLALALALPVAADLPGAAVLAAPEARLAVWLAAACLIGYSGNDLRRWGLARRGFVPHGVVAAGDADAALRRYFDLLPALARRDDVPGQGRV